jgi:hypothetical protein
VERTNKTILDGITACVAGENPNTWEDFLPECVAGMNFSKQRTTGYSPFQVMHGVPPRLPIQLTDTHVEYDLTAADKEKFEAGMSQRSKSLNVAHEKLIDKARARQTADYAKRRSTQTSLPPIGTLVWIRKERKGGNHASTSKQKKKDLGKKPWHGPFKLVGYNRDLSRAIIEAPSGEKWTEAWKDIATKKQMKKEFAFVRALLFDSELD